MLIQKKWFSLPNLRIFVQLQRQEQQQQQPQRRQHSKLNDRAKELFDTKYCMNLVEKNDYENYLCTLLLAKEQRRHAFAVRAFNVEVAKSATNVSEEQIAKIRLKFWYDSIEKCYDNEPSYVADQPVLKELKMAIESAKLSKIYLKRLVNARNRVGRGGQQFQTMKEMENYAEETYSSLLYLLIELCKIKDIHVDHVASHLGKAQGLITLLRAIPYAKRDSMIHIPQDILIKNGVSQERLIRLEPNDKGIEDCIFDVASTAHQHLDKARSFLDKIPQTVRKIFLPCVVVERYLERLRTANFNITHPNCLQRDFMLPLALYIHKLRRKY